MILILILRNVGTNIDLSYEFLDAVMRPEVDGFRRVTKDQLDVRGFCSRLLGGVLVVLVVVLQPARIVQLAVSTAALFVR